MSELAITGYNTEFFRQLSDECSEFTEPAIIDGISYFGIFDENAEMESSDQGGIMPVQTAPRFWLKERPSSLVKDITITIRGLDYGAIRIDPDKNGAYLIYLRVK